MPGLEAAAVDYREMVIEALEPDDTRSTAANVAGPGALLVAKMHKIGERVERARGGGRDRRVDKDAHDVFRLLTARPVDDFVTGLRRALDESISSASTTTAIAYLRDLASGPEAELCAMAGRAVEHAGDPEDVAARTWALSQDLLDRLDEATEKR